MGKIWLPLLALAAICTVPGVASAYIGPGAGIGVLGSFLALLMGIFVAVGVVVSWPVRYMLRRRGRTDATPQPAEAGAEAPEPKRVDGGGT